MALEYDARIDGPRCPAWCQVHARGEGWDRRRSGVTKHCRRVVTVDIGAEVVVEQFASLEDDRVLVEAPMVRLHVEDALPLEVAATLAATLHRVTELVTEPVVAA